MNFIKTSLQYLLALPYRFLYSSAIFYLGVPVLASAYAWYSDGDFVSGLIMAVSFVGFYVVSHIALLSFFFFLNPMSSLYGLTKSYTFNSSSTIQKHLESCERGPRETNTDLSRYHQPLFWFMFSFDEMLFINEFVSDFKRYMKSDMIQSPNFEQDLAKRSQIISDLVAEKSLIYRKQPIAKKTENNIKTYMNEQRELKILKGLKVDGIKIKIIAMLEPFDEAKEFIEFLKRSDLSDKVIRNLNPLLEMMTVMEKSYGKVKVEDLKSIFKNMRDKQKEYDAQNLKANENTLKIYHNYFDKSFKE